MAFTTRAKLLAAGTAGAVAGAALTFGGMELTSSDGENYKPGMVQNIGHIALKNPAVIVTFGTESNIGDFSREIAAKGQQSNVEDDLNAQVPDVVHTGDQFVLDANEVDMSKMTRVTEQNGPTGEPMVEAAIDANGQAVPYVYEANKD